MKTTSKTNVRPAKPAWVSIVTQYHKPHVGKSSWQVISTVTAYFILWYLMVRSLEVGYWLTGLFVIPAALFVVRIFALQHDCGHRSLFKLPRTNEWVGVCCSLLTFVPFHYWRRTHALHHAATGHMDHRGVGDFYTLTVQEYLSKSRWNQFVYRLYRHPIVMFLITPIFAFLVAYRFDFLRRKNWKKERVSLFWTNVGLGILVTGLMWLFGWKAYLLVQIPIIYVATGIGSWLFFVQHNYEDAYWAEHEDWDYTIAALKGSSYYHLPRILQWFTANIGFHHIHHLSPKIPNYLLEKCQKENPIFQAPMTLTLLTGFRTMGLSLWDEENQKLIGFRQLKMIQNSA